ncbi:MAG: coniferyl-alcohol dehydrogenase [Deltaproteobacteria bacterium]|jgi:NAD(P)-dependent dehydrogenase (short-subunit alcohol dehydrogenase family)|nr:coniferyl-alcohol dehydrogenase [Deltaproteobacteria bacterium]
MYLTNKKIVVTGAASGIGAESAREIKRQGGTVIGVDLNQPLKSIDQYIKADLSDPLSIESAVKEIPDGIDAICNIAGLPPTKERAMVIKVNFLGLRHFTELMIDKLNNNASIVNMASLAGFEWYKAEGQIKALLNHRDFSTVDSLCDRIGVSAEAGRSYFFSKETLIVWTMINRWTWRDRGIRMNCISPGPVETPILPDFVKTLGKRAEEDFRVMDRPGQPKDIVPLVTFLCSDGSSWIRGANIPCDGGMYPHILCTSHGYL